MKVVLVLLLLVSSLSFSFELYTTAMNAYNVGDYARALELFERLLRENPKVEELDPYVKLKMGICAYAIGDLAKARTYLSLFPENVISEELLRKLQINEEEWKKYLKPARVSPITSTPTQRKVSPFFSLLVSLLAFLGTFLLVRFVVVRRPAETLANREPRAAIREVEPPKEIPAIPSVESPQMVTPSEFESQIRVIEELLGKISKEEREGEALVVEEEDLLKKAALFFETTEEMPDDVPVSELSLDPSTIFEELDNKEEYTEEDTGKLVKALKVMLREGK